MQYYQQSCECRGKSIDCAGHNAADDSSIVPVILPLVPDDCENSAVGPAAAKNRRVGRDFFGELLRDFAKMRSS